MVYDIGFMIKTEQGFFLKLAQIILLSLKVRKVLYDGVISVMKSRFLHLSHSPQLCGSVEVGIFLAGWDVLADWDRVTLQGLLVRSSMETVYRVKIDRTIQSGKCPAGLPPMVAAMDTKPSTILRRRQPPLVHPLLLLPLLSPLSRPRQAVIRRSK